MTKSFINPVILCGGSGTRLWPLSRKSFPKQYLSFMSKNNKSLLQDTYERISKIENIMDPISASSTWRWFGYDNSMVIVDGINVQSVSGGGHFGGGNFINSEDHARFGLLFLRNGIWDGERLISSEWIEKIRVPSENNPSYGYMWWLNRGNRKWDGLP